MGTWVTWIKKLTRAAYSAVKSWLEGPKSEPRDEGEVDVKFSFPPTVTTLPITARPPPLPQPPSIAPPPPAEAHPVVPGSGKNE